MLLKPVSPTIEYQSTMENSGRWVVGPLERGYGITLGNALRRVLLSSLPGAAVTAVKISGVEQEFSTIPHMKEDTLEFLLNVKGIRLRHLSGRSGKLTLEASGVGPVCAGDIEASAEFEIVNPEHHLATLDSDDAKLEVEFWVDVGSGYLAGGHAEDQPIGVLPVDAIFTPIRAVNYHVGKTRVGDRSDYDELTLDLETDGTIMPEEAVAQSARILIDHLSLFQDVAQSPVIVAKVEEPKALPEQRAIPLEQLGISSRTLNALRRGGITDVGTLLTRSKEELLELKNFGQKSWEELCEQLESSGISLPDEAKGAKDEELEEMKKKLRERFKVMEEK